MVSHAFPCVAQAEDYGQFEWLQFVTLSTLGTLVLTGLLHAFAPRLLAIPWRAAAARVKIFLCGSRPVPTTPLHAMGLSPPASGSLVQSSPFCAPPGPPPPSVGVVRLRAWATKAAFGLMFLVYPAVSTEILKSFRWVRARHWPTLMTDAPLGFCFVSKPTAPVCRVRYRVHRCLDLDDGHEYLSADLRIDCDSPKYKTMLAYSVVMMVVIPIGFPVAFLWVLWRHRRSLYPKNRDRCVRVLHSSDAGSPCIVACVEGEFSTAAREVFHRKVQELGRTLQIVPEARCCRCLRATGRPASSAAPASSSTCAPTPAGALSCGVTAWDAMPGPGHPSLQRAGEPMFHYALPPSFCSDHAAAVNEVADAWHLAPHHYCMRADLDARRADPGVQRFSFLYEVCGSGGGSLVQAFAA